MIFTIKMTPSFMSSRLKTQSHFLHKMAQKSMRFVATAKIRQCFAYLFNDSIRPNRL